jgi:hypothetical protein
MARLPDRVRPRLTRASAVALAGGIAIAMGALQPWYVAVGTGAEADAFSAGRGVLAAAILGLGIVIASSALVSVRHAWVAALVCAAGTLPLGILALGGGGDALRRAGIDGAAVPLGHHPGLGVNLMMCGAVVALAGAGLLWRESR